MTMIYKIFKNIWEERKDIFNVEIVILLRKNRTDSLKYQSVSQSVSQSASQPVGLQSLWRQLFCPAAKKSGVEADRHDDIWSHHHQSSDWLWALGTEQSGWLQMRSSLWLIAATSGQASPQYLGVNVKPRHLSGRKSFRNLWCAGDNSLICHVLSTHSTVSIKKTN